MRNHEEKVMKIVSERRKSVTGPNIAKNDINKCGITEYAVEDFIVTPHKVLKNPLLQNLPIPKIFFKQQ